MQTTRNPVMRAAILAAAALLAACSTTTRVARPDLPMPEAWEEAVPATVAAPDAAATQAGDADAVSAQWWRSFNSPQLDAWVESSLEGGPDLKIAAERVLQARMALRSASSERFPQLGASAGASASRSDAQGAAQVDRQSTSAGLSIGYEVDLWGRVAAGVSGARAQYAATQFDYDALRLAMTGTLASTWFQLLATEERSEIARENLAIAERVLGIVEARYRNGIATSLEVSQQTTAVLQQRTALLPLETQRRQLKSALALLLGEVPQEFGVAGETFQQLVVPGVAPGLPSQLLVRRPDLASAEAALTSADADVHVARTAFLPSISLSGSGGLSTAELVSLANPATSLSAAVSLGLTLFDGGRRSAQVESARSRQRVVEETYAAAVRTALKEVDDALGNADVGLRQEASQRQTVEYAERSLQLAELRYREGADDLLSVLEGQRVLFSAQESLLSMRLQRLNAALDLYRALGGGWVPPEQ